MKYNSSIRICEDECSSCGANYIKNPDDSTTYFPTHIGIVPQRWCPVCGDMLPLVKERDPEYISNNSKKRIIHKVGVSNNLIIKRLFLIYYKFLKDITDKQEFILKLSKESGIGIDKIIPFCM